MKSASSFFRTIFCNCSNVVVQRWFGSSKFLGRDELGHSQRTVGLTRSHGVTVVAGPLDPYGLIGMIQTIYYCCHFKSRTLEAACRARSTNNPQVRFLVGLKPGQETMQNPGPRQRTSKAKRPKRGNGRTVSVTSRFQPRES